MISRYMDKKRINVKIMETLTKEENDQLTENLKKMSDFEFFVDSQISV